MLRNCVRVMSAWTRKSLTRRKSGQLDEIRRAGRGGESFAVITRHRRAHPCSAGAWRSPTICGRCSVWISPSGASGQFGRHSRQPARGEPLQRLEARLVAHLRALRRSSSPDRRTAGPIRIARCTCHRMIRLPSERRAFIGVEELVHAGEAARQRSVRLAAIRLRSIVRRHSTIRVWTGLSSIMVRNSVQVMSAIPLSA